MSNTLSQPLTIVGVPLDLGAHNLGVDIGPDAFRYQRIAEKLQAVGFDVQDAGNIACPSRQDAVIGNDSRLKYMSPILEVARDTAVMTAQLVRAGRKVVSLGGDHSITLGTFSGASDATAGDIGLIYFDAHGDMNTAETTLSGNIHGMHLAALLGFGNSELVNACGEGIKLKTQHLLHVGGSDWDQAELDLVAQHKIQAYTLFDILTQGLSPLIAKINELAQRAPNIYISLDLDSIDQVYAPGAGMPNPKGLSYREIAVLAEYIGQHCNVIAVDVVEYNPLQDIQNKTAELGIELIARFLGKDYSWYANYMAQNRV